jgi:hypothetical protein
VRAKNNANNTVFGREMPNGITVPAMLIHLSHHHNRNSATYCTRKNTAHLHEQ